MNNLISTVEAERIATIPDPVLRNYLITQCYHELSDAMVIRTGAVANWCTFATWASRQAGQTIRQEDLQHAMETRFNAIPELREALDGVIQLALERAEHYGQHGFGKMVWDMFNPKAAMQRASAAVAHGNQKVFAEIGVLFARFWETFKDDQLYHRVKISQFCASLKPGEPPGGQKHLQQAFAGYYRSFFETDAKKKAELLLLANLEIGFHEQTRLQPEIAAALEATLEDPAVIAQRLTDTFFQDNNLLRFMGTMFSDITGRETPIESAVNRFSEVARRHLRLFLTDQMMELGFPNGQRLQLGRDLKASFPANLVKLKNKDLVTLLKQIDKTPDTVLASGAFDWADLPDRLHFIADMFRCFQETPDLLTPPFPPQHVQSIKASLPS
jgi:hypothetical protein